MPKRKRASYREGVEYVALNDEPHWDDPDEVVAMASVQLLAALFGKDPQKVASDVVRFRIKNDAHEEERDRLSYDMEMAIQAEQEETK